MSTPPFIRTLCRGAGVLPWGWLRAVHAVRRVLRHACPSL